MCALKALVIIACLVSVAMARPQINWDDIFVQQQPQGTGFNPNNPFLPTNSFDINSVVLPVSSSTTAAPPGTAPTTPSPAYLACLQNCPTTSEYNPVCGSDTLNYHNTGRLECAQRCGQNVVMVRMGTCRPL